jgi:hypothetical protein
MKISRAAQQQKKEMKENFYGSGKRIRRNTECIFNQSSVAGYGLLEINCSIEQATNLGTRLVVNTGNKSK